MSEIDPDTWPLAETWEDCARHVERGGVVEMYGPFDEWTKCPCSPEHYRAAADRPGQEYQYPRRLVPIPAPADPEAWPVVIDTEANPIGVQVTTDIPAPAPESSPDGEGDVVQDHAERYPIGDLAEGDFQQNTRIIRAWVNGGGVSTPQLREELGAWFTYWGGEDLAARLAAWPEVPDDGVPRPIDVALIEDERARGWINFHPENFCHRCGSRNPSWFAESEAFNAAMGVHAEHKWNGIICIACLAELHAAATGEDSTWQVSRAGSARSWPEVPDGHEVLVVPSEVVDDWASKREGFWMTERERAMAAICRAAVDRRPKPEPQVERVPLWEAVGRTLPDGGVITGWWFDTKFEASGVRFRVDDDSLDGSTMCEGATTVEVLAEDSES